MKKRILVIEDDQGQREICLALLTQLGYSAETSASGEHAVELLKEQDFDLLLLDMILEGGIQGNEAYKQIKQFKPSQKAIIVSGFSKTENVKEALALGADAFLRKPYSINELSEAISKCLED